MALPRLLEAFHFRTYIPMVNGGLASQMAFCFIRLERLPYHKQSSCVVQNNIPSVDTSLYYLTCSYVIILNAIETLCSRTICSLDAFSIPIHHGASTRSARSSTTTCNHTSAATQPINATIYGTFSCIADCALSYTQV